MQFELNPMEQFIYKSIFRVSRAICYWFYEVTHLWSGKKPYFVLSLFRDVIRICALI